MERERRRARRCLPASPGSSGEREEAMQKSDAHAHTNASLCSARSPLRVQFKSGARTLTVPSLPPSLSAAAAAAFKQVVLAGSEEGDFSSVSLSHSYLNGPPTRKTSSPPSA